MTHTRGRLVVACLALIGAAMIAVAGGSAGNDNRDGVGTLVAVPGPGAVTYGENIAYRATFTNQNASSGSVFTQTKFVMNPPVAPGVSAKGVVSSCGTFDLVTGVLTCDFGQLRPGDPPIIVTVVWNVAAVDPNATPGCPDCLVADGTWLIKEGKPTNGNESFPVETTAALLGVNDTPALSARFNAGGYELKGCDSGSTNLSTNSSIDAADPIQSSFCLPASFQAAAAAGGVASTITEPSSGPNIARQSVICIATPGQNCPGGTPATFGGDLITFTFRVADAALLPSGYRITQVFHNTSLLPKCGTAAAAASEDGCVVSITPPKGNPKIWTIVARAKTNGPWSW